MNQVRLLNVDNTQLSYRIVGQGPEMLLLFHGFGQDGRVFEPIASTLGHRFTFCLIDLYFHGQSTWPDDKPVKKDMWQKVVTRLLAELGVDRFSVGGFSIGAKFAFATLEAYPTKINQLLLIAPDGISESFWYKFATGASITRNIFKSLIKHPSPFNTIASTLKFLRVMPPGLARFAMRQMKTKEQRAQVYNAWVVFREIRFDMQSIAVVIENNNIQTTVMIGRKDNVIAPKKMKKLAKYLPKANLVLLEGGHATVLRESLLWLVNN